MHLSVSQFVKSSLFGQCSTIMLNRLVAIAMLSALVVHADPPMLFYDRALFAEFDSSLEQRVNPPVKEPRVIKPTELWESWAVFAYNHVLSFSDTEKRMYYDCIEGDGVPPGVDSQAGETAPRSISRRRICLATSTDGLTWIKPNLGIYNRNGSTANNILVEDSGVSVFLDGAKGVADSERWKMVCSGSAYASPDGLHWTKLKWTATAEDDTKPTGEQGGGEQRGVSYRIAE
jgi:hypothetical protein